MERPFADVMRKLLLEMLTRSPYAAPVKRGQSHVRHFEIDCPSRCDIRGLASLPEPSRKRPVCVCQHTQKGCSSTFNRVAFVATTLADTAAVSLSSPLFVDLS